MKDDLTTMHLQGVARMLALLPTADLEKHVNDCAISLERAESFGCFTDPTAWTKAHNDGSMEDAKLQLEITRYLLAARKAIDRREAFCKTKRPTTSTERTDPPASSSLSHPTR